MFSSQVFTGCAGLLHNVKMGEVLWDGIRLLMSGSIDVDPLLCQLLSLGTLEPNGMQLRRQNREFEMAPRIS